MHPSFSNPLPIGSIVWFYSFPFWFRNQKRKNRTIYPLLTVKKARVSYVEGWNVPGESTKTYPYYGLCYPSKYGKEFIFASTVSCHILDIFLTERSAICDAISHLELELEFFPTKIKEKNDWKIISRIKGQIKKLQKELSRLKDDCHEPKSVV